MKHRFGLAWFYFWGGIMLGLYGGEWIARVDWYGTPMLFIIPPLCLFIATLPEAFVQISRGIRRYRQAAK